MSYFISFLISVAMVEFLRQRASVVGLVERPGDHRTHDVATPVIGGIAIFIAVTCGWVFAPPSGWPGLLSGALLILAFGVWDDRRQISYRYRFAGQIAAASMMVWVGGVTLGDLGHLTTDEHFLYLGRWSTVLTIFATVGAINALNMSDGMDGLSGSLAIVTLVSMVILTATDGQIETTVCLMVVIAAVSGFLLFNVRFPGRQRAHVFLGDSGSMLLGFVLAYFLVDLSQGVERAMDPVTALWIFALPLFDAVGVMCRRIARGKSPFKADCEHYHHYLQAMGYTVNQTLALVLVTAVTFAAIGMLGWYSGISDQFMFYAFLMLFGVFVALMEYLSRRSKEFRGEVVGET